MSRGSLVVALMLVVFVGLPAAAQEYKNSELLMGYTYAYKGAGKFTRENANGWTANYTRNFSSFFGLTTDLGGTYGNVKDLTQLLASPPAVIGFPGMNFGSYQFMLGPRINVRRRWFTPFVQALVGVALTTQSGFTIPLVPGAPVPPGCPAAPATSCVIPSKIATDVAVGGGLGLDLNLISNFGLRLQADVVPVRAQRPDGSEYWQRNIRARPGLVLKW